MDQTTENLLAGNIQEVRTSLVTFQEETRENFRKADDRFVSIEGQLADIREGMSTLHAETIRVENNMLNLFGVLFAHLGIALPTDLLK